MSHHPSHLHFVVTMDDGKDYESLHTCSRSLGEGKHRVRLLAPCRLTFSLLSNALLCLYQVPPHIILLPNRDLQPKWDTVREQI